MKQFVLQEDNLRGHPRFTLFEATTTGDVAGTSNAENWTQVSSDNSPFSQSGLVESNGVTTFTLAATEP